MAEDSDRLGAILRLEANGQLTPDRQEALDRMRSHGQVPSYSLPEGDPAFEQAEQKYGLPTGILRAVQGQESGGVPQERQATARSQTGVTGLMQIEVPTGAPFGLTRLNRTNPYVSIDVGAQVLKDKIAQAKGDLRGGIARYGGPTRPKGYEDQVLGRWQRPTPGGGTAAPSQAPSEQAPEAAPVEQAGIGGTAVQKAANLAATAFYRYPGRWAADLNSVLWKYHASDMAPTEFRDIYQRFADKHFPGANLGPTVQTMPTAAPGSNFETAMRAAAPTEMLWPAGEAVGLAAQELGGVHFGDFTEGLFGFGQLARQAAPIVRSGFKAARAAPGAMRDWLAERMAVRKGAVTAELGLSEASGAAGAQQVADLVQAPAHALTPDEQLASIVQSPTSAADAGRILTAKGKNVETLVPGELAGVRGIKQGLHAEVDRLYTSATRDAQTVPLDTTEKPMLDFKARLQTFLDRHDTASAELAANAGERSGLVEAGPNAPLRVTGISPEEKALLGQMRDLGGQLGVSEAPNVGNHTLADAIKLHSLARSTINRRGSFGGVSNVRADFEAVTNALGDAISATAAGHPEVASKWNAARAYVRDVQAPFVEQTAAKFGAKSKTDIDAFRSLIINKDPTHFERIMYRSGPMTRQQYQEGALSLLADVTKDRHGLDLTAMKKVLKNLPVRTQQLMFGHKTLEGATALANWHPGGASLDEAAVNKGVEAFYSVFDEAQKFRRDAKAVAAAGQAAKDAGATGGVNRILRSSPSTFAFYHLARAALTGSMIMTATSNSGTQNQRMASMATQLAMFAMLSVEPSVLRAMFIADPSTVYGSKVAAQIETVLRAYTNRQMHDPKVAPRTPAQPPTLP